MTDDTIPAEPSGRWRRLKEATAETHEKLDRRIMAAEPFASRERYASFLLVQHAFHRDIRALYDRAELQQLFPDLATRARLDAAAQDLADVGAAPSAVEASNSHLADADIPTAIGWLYVAEGSNLGAALLLKAAARLGFDDKFGARHLAAAPEGRGLSWRKFTTALDAVSLSDAEEEQLFAAARTAFNRVHALVEAMLPASAERIPAPEEVS